MDRKHLVDTSSDEVVLDTEKLLKKTGKQKGKRTRRVTRIRRVGIQDDVVQNKLASSNENYIISISQSGRARPISFEHGSKSNFQPNHSNDNEEVHSKKIRALKRDTLIGMSRGITR